MASKNPEQSGKINFIWPSLLWQNCWDKQALKEEGFTWGHTFESCKPWSFGTLLLNLCVGSTHAWYSSGWSKIPEALAAKGKQRWGGGEITVFCLFFFCLFVSINCRRFKQSNGCYQRANSEKSSWHKGPGAKVWWKGQTSWVYIATKPCVASGMSL